MESLPAAWTSASSSPCTGLAVVVGVGVGEALVLVGVGDGLGEVFVGVGDGLDEGVADGERVFLLLCGLGDFIEYLPFHFFQVGMMSGRRKSGMTWEPKTAL